MSIYKHIIEHEDILSKENLLDIIHILSNKISDSLDKEEKHYLKRKVWCIISNGHYNEKYAEEDVAKMYIPTKNGNLYAPFYKLEKTTQIYENLKQTNDILSNYNKYDFYVVMNMIKSDNYNLYKKRFSGYNDNMLDELFVEDALNWLDDSDNPYGLSKVWKYLNK